jgi:hypothetical protein
MIKNMPIFIALTLFLLSGTTTPQSIKDSQLPLTVRQIMNSIVTPTTGIIWGAYELEAESEWMDVKNAALSLIDAGALLNADGLQGEERLIAREDAWKEFNAQMISAAEKVIEAVEAKDEERLFSVGNDLLYPPCESCHQEYQNQ